MLPGLMRRPHITSLLAIATLVVVTIGCAGSDAPPTTTSSMPPTSTTGADEALLSLVLQPGDLPEGFMASPQVDDTATTFCAAEDAAAGLRATAREVRGFTNAGSGASVIQLAFRFEDDDAAQFVTQASEVLERCNRVPDISGLAFEYDSLSPELEGLLEQSTSAVGRHGVSIGSGSLSINVVVVQQGDVGELVAVLGVDVPRADLDALALTAIGAALAKL